MCLKNFDGSKAWFEMGWLVHQAAVVKAKPYMISYVLFIGDDDEVLFSSAKTQARWEVPSQKIARDDDPAADAAAIHYRTAA